MTRRSILGSALVLVVGAVGVFLWTTVERSVEEMPNRTVSYDGDAASTDRDTFTVVTYNLGSGSERASSGSESDSRSAANTKRAADLIRQANPDVVGVQGVRFEGEKGPDTQQLATMATRLGMSEALQSKAESGRLRSWIGSRASGQAVLSRYPIRRYTGRRLARPFYRVGDGPDSFVQIAALDVGGWPLIVMNVHLSTTPEIREEQARVLKKLYTRLSRQSFPILVVGTFNSLMPGAASSVSTGETDAFAEENAMHLLLDRTSLKPALSSAAAPLLGKDVSTYPIPNPTQKLDYVLHAPNLVVPVEARTLCGKRTHAPSDHCAVAMSFLLPRPKDKLPDEQIPDERLPALERLLEGG